MILKFGDRPAQLFAKPSMPIHFIGSRADGVGEGSPILYGGVNVGRVTGVTRTSMTEIRLDASVDRDPPLPANVEGRIVAQSLLGAGSAISLELVPPGRPTTQPRAEVVVEPVGQLESGATIPARFVGLDLLPPEFAGLATELRATTVQFRESKIIEHLDQQVLRVGELVESVQSLVDDKQMRADLQASLANVRTATETANRIGTNLEKLTAEANLAMTDVRATVGEARTTVAKAGTNVDDISRQVGQRLTQVAGLLDTFQSISNKIDTGKGTAGQFVNDPRLYESLVDTSRQLNATVTDLKRLIEQWEQEGPAIQLR
jgi:phospholipid/cholesterol/gamma-HCH transport system substrate-binding protein